MDNLNEIQTIRPTKERHRHDEITIPEKDKTNQHDRPARVETQSQIDRYERRQLLKSGDDEQSKRLNAILAEAGHRYFTDAYYAGSVPRPLALSAERVDRSAESLSDRHMAAVFRRNQAIRALDQTFVQILEWVCVEDHSAQSWAMKHGHFADAGIVILRLALLALARHYGLLPSARNVAAC